MKRQMKNGRRPYVTILPVIIFLVGFIFIFNVISLSMVTKGKKAEFPQWQKGMCYVTWNKNRYKSAGSDESLEKLAATNTEWVALVATWYQDRYNSTDIHPTNKTPGDEGLIHAIEKIHSLGMKVMLKPHLDLLDNSNGKWRGVIEFETDSDWQRWFENYRNFITHYAQIAQEHNVEMFCIGTELVYPATIHSELWRKMIIKDIREAYEGPLTYAANWSGEYLDIEFWDALDYAGLDCYFPLSTKDKPTLNEIKKGWLPQIKQIEAWQERVGKPVILTECGYKSSVGAAKTPWRHMKPGIEVDLKQQADCYQSLLETFWDKEWLYGIYWWHWGTDVKMDGANNSDFIVQNKPAEEVVRKWYRKKAPLKD